MVKCKPVKIQPQSPSVKALHFYSHVPYLAFIPGESFTSLHFLALPGGQRSFCVSPSYHNEWCWQGWLFLFSFIASRVTWVSTTNSVLPELVVLLLPCAPSLIAPAGHSQHSAPLYFTPSWWAANSSANSACDLPIPFHSFPTLLSACSLYFIKHILCFISNEEFFMMPGWTWS